MAATPPGQGNTYEPDEASFRSLTNKLHTAVVDGLNSAFANFDPSKFKFGQNDLVAGLKEANKVSEKLLENRSKINKGEISSREILKQVQDYQSKINEIQNHKNRLIDQGVKLDKKLLKSLEEQEAINIANIQSLQAQASEAAKTNGVYKEMTASMKEVGVDLDKIFGAIYSRMKLIDEQTGNLAKSLNTSYDAAFRYRTELSRAAESSGHIYATSKKMAEAAIELNQQYGLSARYDAEKLDAYTKLATYSGYDKETQADILRYSYLTGKSVDQINGSRLATIKITSALTGRAISEKVVMQDIAKASAAVKLSMMATPGAIEKAAATARSFAVSMGQTEKMAENLMNFEASIQKQMEAEVLTGQTLNLERARYAALTNDIGGMVTELNSQGITSDKFAKMNRIQQQAIAESMGMQKDEMAQMLMDQDLASKIGAKDLDSVKAKYLEQVKLGKGQEYLNSLGNAEVQRQVESVTQQQRIAILTEKLLSTVDRLFEAFKPFLDGIISFGEWLGKSEFLLKGISILVAGLAASKLWNMAGNFGKGLGNITGMMKGAGGAAGSGTSMAGGAGAGSLAGATGGAAGGATGGAAAGAGATGGGLLSGVKSAFSNPGQLFKNAIKGIDIKSYFGKVAKIGGVAALLEVIMGHFDVKSMIAEGGPREELNKKVGQRVAAGIGSVAGGAILGALMSPIPGGAFIGGVMGSMGGKMLGEWLGENASGLGAATLDTFYGDEMKNSPKLAEGGLVTQTGMAKVDAGEVYLGANSLQILKDLVTETRQQNQYLQALVKKDTNISMDGQAVAGVVARNVITSYGNLLNPSSATYA